MWSRTGWRSFLEERYYEEMNKAQTVEEALKDYEQTLLPNAESFGQGLVFRDRFFFRIER